MVRALSCLCTASSKVGDARSSKKRDQLLIINISHAVPARQTQQSLPLLQRPKGEGTTICVMSASEPARRPRHRQNSWPVVLHSHLSVATRVRRRRRAKKLTSGAPFLFGSHSPVFIRNLGVRNSGERAPPPVSSGQKHWLGRTAVVQRQSS